MTNKDYRTYCKTVFVLRDKVSDFSGAEHTQVHEATDPLTERCTGQGGVWLDATEVEKDLMTSYRGMSDAVLHRKFGTPEDHLRHLALHFQMFHKGAEWSPKLVLLDANLVPLEGKEAAVDAAMAELGYERFTLDPRYMDVLAAKDLTPEAVFTRNLTYPQLERLLVMTYPQPRFINLFDYSPEQNQNFFRQLATCSMIGGYRTIRFRKQIESEEKQVDPDMHLEGYLELMKQRGHHYHSVLQINHLPGPNEIDYSHILWQYGTDPLIRYANVHCPTTRANFRMVSTIFEQCFGPRIESFDIHFPEPESKQI